MAFDIKRGLTKAETVALASLPSLPGSALAILAGACDASGKRVARLLDHGAMVAANQRARRAAEKQAPAYSFGVGWPLNPVLACRLEGLKAAGWVEAGEEGKIPGAMRGYHHASDTPARLLFARDGARCGVSTVSAGIYHSDGELWGREARDAITQTGREIVAAQIEAKATKSAKARKAA